MAIETTYKTDNQSSVAGRHLGTGGQVIVIGAASVASTVLAVGEHRISGSGAIWFRQGGSGVTATAGAGSTYLASGVVETFNVTGTADGYVAVIRDGAATGNVSITQIR